MNPRQFEIYVEKYFKQEGYKTTLTNQSADYGVDVFAEKNKEKIAIQAKMFGDSQRKINRKAMMELHGAKEYFDCTKAMMVTNGKVLDDAIEVANKLNIEIIYLDNNNHYQKEKISDSSEIDFNTIWEKYVFPLGGGNIKQRSRKVKQNCKS